MAEKLGKLPPIDAQAYEKLIEDLLAHGACKGKTQSVAAVLFQDMKIETLTQTGLSEVEGKVQVEPTYLVMDLTQYPDKESQNVIINEILTNYGDRISGERTSGEQDISASGIWLVKKRGFEQDYRPSENGNFEPNPDAFRLCLKVDKQIGLPVMWDQSFAVEDGGTVAIRAKDVPQMIEAMRQVAEGKISARDALLQPDGKSRFDVYGMEPGFAEKNYAAAPLPQAIQGQMNDYQNWRAALPEKTVSSLSEYARRVPADRSAVALGMGIATYPVFYKDSAKAYTVDGNNQGIADHSNETILAGSGKLNTLIKDQGLFYASTEYALLSQEDDRFTVRQYAHWKQPTYDPHEDDLLHVLREEHFENENDAIDALRQYDALLQARQSPMCEQFGLLDKIRAEAEGKLSRGESLGDTPPQKKSVLGNLASMFQQRGKSDQSDVVARFIDWKMPYSSSPYEHVGLKIDTAMCKEGQDFSPALAGT